MKFYSCKSRFSKTIAVILSVTMILLTTACGSSDKVKLDPKSPVTISIWHYYNGAILNAFDEMVKDFNETVGSENGIIVETYGLGNVSDLEKAVIASANKEIGSMDIPNIFASYADTAYEAEKRGLLANLGDYLSSAQQQEYLDSYIEEGKIGLDGELRIFPVAKSTEIFMINETDWLPFAAATGLDYGSLSTMEGIAETAKLYYEWTDAQTPDQLYDGKAFFGRDSMANFFIIASKEFGIEIFNVENGKGTIEVNEAVMRKIWDNYYLPYISGYYLSSGRYRSDDTKVGDIISYVGSTSSTAYFPSEVTSGGSSYPVESKILPVPRFEGAERVMVQQGAGMVVTKSDPQREYASVIFLEWFTEASQNIEFAALSGYMPVKKEAIDYERFITEVNDAGIPIDSKTDETLRISFEEMTTSELYTSKAFDGGAPARSVLEYNLQDKAVADREEVVNLIADGATHEEAVAKFATEANFKEWLDTMTQKLNDAIK